MNERLKILISYLIETRKVFNQTDFANIIGKSKSQLSEMISNKRPISEQTVHIIISKFPEFNRTWLLTGEGEMINNSDDLKGRLLEFIDSQGISKSEFERNVGLSNGYINNFKGSLGSEKLECILIRYPKLNVRWLILGEGEMTNEGCAGNKKTETMLLKALSAFHTNNPDEAKDIMCELQLLKQEKELRAKFDMEIARKDEIIAKLTDMLEVSQKKVATDAKCADAKQVG